MEKKRILFYLIRHGETDWNLSKRMQGRDDIPLNRSGRLQAEQIAEALAAVPFSLIVTSPLSRAADTAKAVGSRHPGVPIVEDPLLVERDKGNVSGLTPAEREAFLASGGTENQEPVTSVRTRAREALAHCMELIDAARPSYEPDNSTVHVAVVTHGGLIYHLLNSISEDILNTPSGRRTLRNASVCILTDADEVLAVDLTADEFGGYWDGQRSHDRIISERPIA